MAYLVNLLASSKSIEPVISEQLLRDLVLWIDECPSQVARLLGFFLDSDCDGTAKTLSGFIGYVLAKE